MEQEGFVSLWVGQVKSSEELDRLLRVSYSEEGDFIPSMFANNFNFYRYDDSVRESEYYEEETSDLSRLLKGFSYDDEIIPKFIDLVQGEFPSDVNAVILIYNFRYTGEIVESKIRSNHLKFLGVVEY